jgi:hypothetical protein
MTRLLVDESPEQPLSRFMGKIKQLITNTKMDMSTLMGGLTSIPLGANTPRGDDTTTSVDFNSFQN